MRKAQFIRVKNAHKMRILVTHKIRIICAFYKLQLHNYNRFAVDGQNRSSFFGVIEKEDEETMIIGLIIIWVFFMETRDSFVFLKLYTTTKCVVLK